ncbi:MAG TPA: ATP-binding protein [Pseudorhizobium sp.]|nr:ATP-binding protein [Pseudorhizobium sp.]
MSVNKHNLPQEANSPCPVAAGGAAFAGPSAASSWRWRLRGRFSVAALSAGTAIFSCATGAVAQTDPSIKLFTSTEVVISSLVFGALGAALLSVLWLVRQRGNMEAETQEMRNALTDAQQQISKYEALIADKNRRIVIWDGSSTKAELLGQLPVETGAPQQDSEFLAFGRWLRPTSAGELERAIETLRSNAQSFDTVVETHRDEILEVQGRVSGGKAFVRFIALNNLRAELAELKIERERLQGSITLFHSLLDAIEQPVWRRDTSGRLTWVNHAYSEAVDATAPGQVLEEGREFLGTVAREKIRASVTPDSPFHERISTVVQGNRTIYDIVDVVATSGSAGMAVDVSEAEAVREELKRTLRSHAETLDHLATPVAIFDRDRRLQFYNQAFVSLWGLGIAFLDSRPDNNELLDRLRGENKLPEQLNWRSWKEGALSIYQSLDTKTDLWHLPNGQTLRVIATAHPQGGATWVFENLTEQVDLETRYNTLLMVQGETIDHLSEGVAVFGPDGRLRLSNPAFRALWGVTAEQAKAGEHIRAIEEACAPSYDKPNGWRRFGQMITNFDDGRPSLQGTLELYSGLILDYAVTPLPNAQTMLTFVDMTASARAERALMEKNEALRRADEIKNDFVQHVSYELRSPLTNIIGFTDLLKTPGIGPLNERQAEYIEHISTSSSLLLTIVNDILDLATVDAGIMQLNYEEISIDDLLDDVAMQIADRLHDNQMTLEITAPKGLGDIVADPQRLKQILLKLLTNATNFAPEGSTITLSCRRDASSVLFAVSDSGPGIPEDMLSSVFNRFSSTPRGGKRSGAGLGLSIVESFVHLHKGEVAIDSRPGGTTVTCRIPSGSTMRTIAAAE